MIPTFGGPRRLVRPVAFVSVLFTEFAGCAGRAPDRIAPPARRSGSETAIRLVLPPVDRLLPSLACAYARQNATNGAESSAAGAAPARAGR